jgi:hypothetical protein
LAPDLDPDSIADDLAPGGAEADVVLMVGFLGESDADGHVRLFLDRELTLWFDIPTEHVKRRSRVADDVAGEQTAIWIAGEWMRRPLFDEEQINAMAETFLVGPVAMSRALPDTVEEAMEDAARRTPRCPTRMCTPLCR